MIYFIFTVSLYNQITSAYKIYNLMRVIYHFLKWHKVNSSESRARFKVYNNHSVLEPAVNECKCQSNFVGGTLISLSLHCSHTDFYSRIVDKKTKKQKTWHLLSSDRMWKVDIKLVNSCLVFQSPTLTEERGSMVYDGHIAISHKFTKNVLFHQSHMRR